MLTIWGEGIISVTEEPCKGYFQGHFYKKDIFGIFPKNNVFFFFSK